LNRALRAVRPGWGENPGKGGKRDPTSVKEKLDFSVFLGGGKRD